MSALSLRAIAKQSRCLLRLSPGLLRHFVPRNDHKCFEEGYRSEKEWQKPDEDDEALDEFVESGRMEELPELGEIAGDKEAGEQEIGQRRMP